MNTLTINLPDSVDPARARWELARLLYEKGEITLEEGAKLVDLAPVYFRRRLENPSSKPDPVREELLKNAEPFDRKRFDELIDQLNIQESWEELVAMIGK